MMQNGLRTTSLYLLGFFISNDKKVHLDTRYTLLRFPFVNFVPNTTRKETRKKAIHFVPIGERNENDATSNIKSQTLSVIFFSILKSFWFF